MLYRNPPKLLCKRAGHINCDKLTELHWKVRLGGNLNSNTKRPRFLKDTDEKERSTGDYYCKEARTYRCFASVTHNVVEIQIKEFLPHSAWHRNRENK